MTVHPTELSGEMLADRVREIVANHRDDRGALLPILHSIQDEFGCVSRTVIPLVANQLNLSRAEVHGVVSFYRDFRDEPAGRTTVRVCQAEACQSVGANELSEAVREQLGISFGETTPERDVTLDEVFCLGNCALGPSAQINQQVYGLLDADRLRHLVDQVRGS